LFSASEYSFMHKSMQECFALHMAPALRMASFFNWTSDIDVFMFLAQFVDRVHTDRMGGGSAGDSETGKVGIVRCRC
jgi:hypothetical protein